MSPPSLLPLPSSLQRCPMQPRHCRASGPGPPNSPKRRLDVRLSVCWGHWVCRDSHGAVVPSAKPVSSFCTCTQCVCRRDVLDEVPEGVRGCAESSQGRRLLVANDLGQPRAQPAELFAPFYLFCNTARWNLSSSNTTKSSSKGPPLCLFQAEEKSSGF